MNNRFICWVAVASALCALPAYAEKSKPTCPVPNGVTCMSTIDIYRATNSSDKVTSAKQGEEQTAPLPPPKMQMQMQMPVASVPSGPTGPVAYRPAEYAQLAVQGDALVIRNTTPEDVPVPATHADVAPSTEPYRVPAQIMQIYIAPWQDEQGDLHLPERVVTEIEPRHWSLGAPAPDASTSFHLLELPSEAAKDSQPAVQANTARGQSGS